MPQATIPLTRYLPRSREVSAAPGAPHDIVNMIAAAGSWRSADVLVTKYMLILMLLYPLTRDKPSRRSPVRIPQTARSLPCGVSHPANHASTQARSLSFLFACQAPADIRAPALLAHRRPCQFSPVFAHRIASPPADARNSVSDIQVGTSGTATMIAPLERPNDVVTGHRNTDKTGQHRSQRSDAYHPVK